MHLYLAFGYMHFLFIARQVKLVWLCYVVGTECSCLFYINSRLYLYLDFVITMNTVTLVELLSTFGDRCLIPNQSFKRPHFFDGKLF